MGFYRSFLILTLSLLPALTGCSPTGSSESAGSRSAAGPSAAAADSVYVLLQDAGDSALREAFDARSSTSYFRRTLTRQMDPATDQPIASYQRLIRHEAGGDGTTTLIESDSSGVFHLGVLSGLMNQSSDPGVGSNPIPHLLPDDPAYLSDRGPGLYNYEMLADTSIAGRRAAVAKISVSPGATDDEQIRAARFYIDRSTMELVGVRLHRQQRALLFSEESTVEVYLQRIDSNQWFPARTRYRTTLDIPFLSAKQLETETQYYTVLPEG